MNHFYKQSVVGGFTLVLVMFVTSMYSTVSLAGKLEFSNSAGFARSYVVPADVKSITFERFSTVSSVSPQRIESGGSFVLQPGESAIISDFDGDLQEMDFRPTLIGLTAASGLETNASISSNEHGLKGQATSEKMDSELIQKLRIFFASVGIEPNQAVAITIQRNHTTEYTSLIIDMVRGIIVGSYPCELLTNYKQLVVGSFLVCVNADLPVLPIATFPEFTDQTEDVIEQPFCCDPTTLTPYRARRLDREKEFTGIITTSGSYPNIIYQVTRQINNGPVQSISFWQLIKNNIVPWMGSKPEQKLHAFKNYICHECDLFFSVDIFSTNAERGYNFHHMRLVPHTKVNDALLKEFFTAAGIRDFK